MVRSVTNRKLNQGRPWTNQGGLKLFASIFDLVFRFEDSFSN